MEGCSNTYDVISSLKYNCIRMYLKCKISQLISRILYVGRCSIIIFCLRLSCGLYVHDLHRGSIRKGIPCTVHNVKTGYTYVYVNSVGLYGTHECAYYITLWRIRSATMYTYTVLLVLVVILKVTLISRTFLGKAATPSKCPGIYSVVKQHTLPEYTFPKKVR